MKLTRRTFVGASALAALPMPAFAQEKVVRFGISMADVPLTTGQPDRGAGAYKFTGLTLYDPLVAWELDVSERPDDFEISWHLPYCTFAFARMNSSTSFFSLACALRSM